MSRSQNKPLTDKQSRILDFVRESSAENGFPPTLREIGEAVGVANVSAVRGHLAAIEKKGYITKDPDKARSIRIVGDRRPSVLSRFKRKLHQFARTDEGVVHRVVYGIVLATRKRRRHFVGRGREWMIEALDKRAAEHGWTFLEQRVEPDHVVLIVEVWPTHSPGRVVSRVRHAGESLKRRHMLAFPGRRMWATGYAVTTDLERLDEMAEQFLAEVPPETAASEGEKP